MDTTTSRVFLRSPWAIIGDAYLECPDDKSEDRVQFMVAWHGMLTAAAAAKS